MTRILTRMLTRILVRMLTRMRRQWGIVPLSLAAAWALAVIDEIGHMIEVRTRILTRRLARIEMHCRAGTTAARARDGPAEGGVQRARLGRAAFSPTHPPTHPPPPPPSPRRGPLGIVPGSGAAPCREMPRVGGFPTSPSPAPRSLCLSEPLRSLPRLCPPFSPSSLFPHLLPLAHSLPLHLHLPPHSPLLRLRGVSAGRTAALGLGTY